MLYLFPANLAVAQLLPDADAVELGLQVDEAGVRVLPVEGADGAGGACVVLETAGRGQGERPALQLAHQQVPRPACRPRQREHQLRIAATLSDDVRGKRKLTCLNMLPRL